MLCSHCKVWELEDLDTYCSWCSKLARELTVHPNPPDIIYGDSRNHELILENTGSIGNITIKKIEPGQNWIKIDGENLTDQEIRLKHSKTIPFAINFQYLADDFHTGFIKVETGEIGPKEAKILVYPIPETIIEDKIHTLYLESEAKEYSLPIDLQLKKGKVTIEDIRVADSDWAQVDFDKTAKKIELDSRINNLLKIFIIISAAKIPPDKSKHIVKLAIKFAGSTIERTQNIQLKCLIPPKLQIIDRGEKQFQIKVFHHEIQEYTLPLQNGDNNELTRQTQIINKIQPTRPWLELISPRPDEFPLEIQSGATTEFKFRIEADKVGDNQEVNCTDTAELIFETTPPLPQKISGLQPISVSVTEKPVYDGWLCIDFGTTNTCVGISKGENSDFVIYELDYIRGKVLPSVIQYHNFKDGNRKYSIGSAPYLNFGSPGNEKTVVSQIKRKLGKQEKIDVKFSERRGMPDDVVMSLSSKEIATDIFKKILNLAEKELQAKIVRCAISHPSRFNQQQLQDLYEIIEETFKETEIPAENIKLFHEPVAAAVDYLSVDYQSLSDKESHNIVVYDFGGGTTDFALIHIKKRIHPKRGLIIMPEVLAVDGHPALGGEDITDMIVDLYKPEIDKLLVQLKAKDNSIKDIRLSLNKDEETSTVLKEKAWKNYVSLRQWSEQKKIEIVEILSKENEEFGEVNLPTDLTVIINGQPEPDKLLAKSVTIRRDDFKREFYIKIDPVIQKLKELTDKLLPGKSDIDKVLLSGQSSQFPLVKERIKEKLGIAEDRITLVKNPKECVVRGLCILHSDELGAGMSVRVDSQGCLSATTSRLGLRVKDQGQYRFKQLVGVGHPIGKDGYASEIKGVFFRRNTTIPLYEHMGPESDSSFPDGSPLVRQVKNFKIMDGLAKIEVNDFKVTDQMLEDADFWFRITPDQQVELEIKFKPEDKIPSIIFKATRPGF